MDYKAADERCPDIVRTGFSQLYSAVKTPGFQATVTDTFKWVTRYTLVGALRVVLCRQ